LVFGFSKLFQHLNFFLHQTDVAEIATEIPLKNAGIVEKKILGPLTPFTASETMKKIVTMAQIILVVKRIHIHFLLIFMLLSRCFV